MAMKRKIKILLIVVFLIALIPVLLIFVFPYFDFMYVSADKHWLKGKIADQDDNTGGKSIKKVEQGENVEYFVYKDRLMCIEDTGDKVKEICKLPNNIVGILVNDKDILLYDNVPGGAGHVKRLLSREAIAKSLKTGLEKVSK